MIAGEQAHTLPDDSQQFAYRTVSYIGYYKQRFEIPESFQRHEITRVEWKMFVPGRGGMAFPLRYVLNLTGISNCKFIVFCLSIHILVVYLCRKIN